MEFLDDFSRTWADPQLRHALIVHWPVVLSALSVLLTLALLVAGGRNATLRVITLLCCLAMMAGAYMGSQSGSRAENSVGTLSSEAHHLLEEHEELGEKTPLFAAVCAGLVLLTFIAYKPLRVSAAALGFVCCAGTAGWIANTAHHGGLLVYEHGVGTPQTASPAEPIPTGSDGQANQPSAEAAAFFRQTVWPILSEHCIGCHNPQRAGRSGGLDQTTRATLLKGGRHGPAIVPGKPDESLLIRRVTGADPERDRMPPPPDPPLSAQQIEALKQWIRDGAAWAD